MPLSTELISEFVKVTKDDTKKKSETIVYGTVVKSEGANYVKLDGAEVLTPVTSTTNLEDKERVTVMIKNHTAVVTGNITSPAARTAEVEGVSTEVKNVNEEITKVKTLVADKVSTALLEAQVARIETLEAKDATITGKLTAAEADIKYLKSDEATIGHINAITAKINEITTNQLTADALYAALAKINVLIAGTAEFDKATVQHLVANVFNLTGKGVAEEVFIHNLVVSYAQMVSAAIGNLCIKASDGNYYTLDVGADGKVNATKTTVTSGEISAGATNAGNVILETSIAAESLSAGNIKATYALVNKIDAARIDVDQLFAREAFISKITTGLIIGDKTLTQIGGEITNVNNKIDNLQIGGRNYILNTGIQFVASNNGTAGKTLHLFLCKDAATANSLYGKTVTISFDYKSTVTSGRGSMVYNNAWQVIYRFAAGDASGHVEETITLNQATATTNQFVYIQGDWVGDITITNLKVEIGNKATDWTPAPEDMQESINNTQADVDFATPYDSEEPPTTVPVAGKLWIDRGITPPIFRRWKGKNASTERDWSDALALTSNATNTSPNAYYDNTTGLLESVDSVLTTFTPGQDGSGTPGPGNIRELRGYTHSALWQNSYGQTDSVEQKCRIEFGETIYGAEIDWLNGIWRQTHWEYALTGEETISVMTHNGAARFAIRIPNDKYRPAASRIPFCTHFLGSDAPYGANNIDYAICVDANLIYLTASGLLGEVVNARNYLKNQTAAGNPVRVVVKLKEPIVHTFTPAVVDVFETMLFLHVSPDTVVAPRTLAVTGTFSGWETLNSSDDIRAAQEQLKTHQQNAQAAIDELRTAVVTDNDGVHVRKVDNDNVQLIQNEVLITQKDVNIVSGGKKNSTFGDGYVRLLNMIIRVAGNGLVIEAVD